jgi:hypothetical protein
MGPRNCLRSVNVRAARCAVFMAPIILTVCQPAVLDPQGPVGLAQKTILIDSLAIMLAIVVPTIAALIAMSSSLAPTSAASKICARFARRMLATAQERRKLPRSPWLSSTR